MCKCTECKNYEPKNNKPSKIRRLPKLVLIDRRKLFNEEFGGNFEIEINGITFVVEYIEIVNNLYPSFTGKFKDHCKFNIGLAPVNDGPSYMLYAESSPIYNVLRFRTVEKSFLDK